MPGTGILTLLTLFGGYAVADGDAERLHLVELSRIAPLHADRQLHVTRLQGFGWQKTVPAAGLRLRAGVTVLRATGRITQLEGSYDEGTLRSVELDSPGWGIGPAVEAGLTVARAGPWALGVEGSAAVLAHDRRFPAGGMHYIGQFDLGPSLRWHGPGGGELAFGVRWSHLSNGHGLTPRNPSYEGRVFSLSMQWPLRGGASSAQTASSRSSAR